MPGIGNPYQSTNPFGQIKMRQAPRNQGKKNNVGDKLNKLAGINDQKFFVDKNKHNKMGKDGFLKLLATQLQNQDPIKPVDQKQFAADLAQFAQLEQMTNMNTKLQKGLEGNNSQDKFYGASFLGKEIITSGTSVHVDGNGSSLALPFHLSKNAKKVMIRVYDKNNQIIKQFDNDALTKGANSISWDGTANDGYVATKGEYRFEVLAWDKDYNKFKGETKATGLVAGVTFEGNETILQLKNGKKVFLRDVQKFQLPKISHDVKKVPGLKKVAHKVYNDNGSNVTNY